MDESSRRKGTRHKVSRSRAGAALGAKGGMSHSPAKVAAARANGAKGGRPPLPSPAQMEDLQTALGLALEHAIRNRRKRDLVTLDRPGYAWTIGVKFAGTRIVSLSALCPARGYYRIEVDSAGSGANWRSFHGVNGAEGFLTKFSGFAANAMLRHAPLSEEDLRFFLAAPGANPALAMENPRLEQEIKATVAAALS